MTDIDSAYLLKLARDKSVERRRLLTEIIADLFQGDGKVLTERERALMFNIMHKMVRDAELSIRQIIGQRLADVPDVPHELALFLANDDIEVAYPILSGHTVLQDEDLIEIIRNRTLEHQLAVAIRRTVSEEVSDELVETGHEGVITTLLKNSGARISTATMEYLVEESKRVDSFREPILRREDLDPALAKRMYMWVSAALRQHIVEKYDLDQGVVDDLLERSVLEGVAQTSGGQQSKKEKLVAELDKKGDKIPSMLIRALRDGEVTLFMTMFRQLTNLREILVNRILFEPGGEGLAIACKAIGISKTDFSTIFSLTRMAISKNNRLDNNETEKIIAIYGRISTEASREVVVRWRRNVGYLAALRDLEIQ